MKFDVSSEGSDSTQIDRSLSVGDHWVDVALVFAISCFFWGAIIYFFAVPRLAAKDFDGLLSMVLCGLGVLSSLLACWLYVKRST